ncbi:Rh type C glycoprotein2b [Capsaspora owczarzaki ATCC 30864]|uniref:Rh type C glycoprotein2b n=1 Tax=Capsaspora owczarzaki (strain ATCC 30864) TaxID=595528 RepID=A0A0D2WSQ3_CAPO3|nr:Rh type C glycoprotein2b [Capsaspora owczarzaki ATCC 30864]KJE94518.1 Rh type C glycoprotein2b [Capsaspora owczarzaki ATCC 30864]|eukprot:XP_004346836.1 Rh type C glycoprotein2b [Capsaspora owczarzaki ATCC 30864]
MAGNGKLSKFPAVAAALQVMLLVFFACFVAYGHDASNYADTDNAAASAAMVFKYGKFQDVHVMMLIGFGFLMTFLKKHAFTAVGVNFFLTAFVLQWVTLTNGFFEKLWEGHDALDHKIEFSILTMINSDFGVAAVLISFGAVIGKASPLQLVTMAFFECIFYSGNIILCIFKFNVVDIGGSIAIHTFGAYFGLAVSYMITTPKARNNKNNGSMYYNDLFAMIGTLFLWMFWPSFNGALASGSAEHRVMTNTLLSLCGCCVSTFIFSMLLRQGHKFDMVDIQNATLAGGVAVGACANLVIQPWGALLIGIVAGFVSVFGYTRIQGMLEEKIGLHDTCGVHNLHGMPGLLGGIASACAAAAADTSTYTVSGILANFPDPIDRSQYVQGGYQLLSVFVTAGIAIVCGLFVGWIIRRPWFEPPETNFNDEEFWHVPLGTEDDDPEMDPAKIREMKLAKPQMNARSNNFNTAMRRKGPGASNNTMRLSATTFGASQPVKDPAADRVMAANAAWDNPLNRGSLDVPGRGPSIIVESSDDIIAQNYKLDMEAAN